MKKILCVTLSLLLLFTLGACLTDEDLAETKSAAITQLDGVDLSIYREEEKSAVILIISTAKDAINNSTEEAKVSQIVYKALNDIAKIKTALELAAEENEQIEFNLLKTNKKNELDTLVNLANYYAAEVTLINTTILSTKILIDEASSVAEVELYFLAAKMAILAVNTKDLIDTNLGDDLEEAINLAKELITNFVDLTIYRANERNVINQIILEAIVSLDDAKANDEITVIINTAKQEILKIKTAAELSAIEATEAFIAAKEEYINNLNSYYNSSNYYPEQIQELNSIILNGKAALENATTLDSLENTYNSYLLQINAVQTKNQIDGETPGGTDDEEIPGGTDDEETPPVDEVDDDIIINGTIEIIEVNGYQEGLYLTWKKVANATFYNVYYKENSVSSYVLIDDMLIREYPNYYRADIVGLKKGDYDVKVVATANNVETNAVTIITNVTTSAHIREGYGFVNGTSSGAYNEDGTLKANALVLYVTDQNKNSISALITGDKNVQTGLRNIISILSKGAETRPIAIRFIGNVTTPSETDGGDLVIDTKNTSHGITIEGIGNDTYINGWGIRLKRASNVEIRNIGFMLTASSEGDNVGLQQGNDHIWVHNNDFFYGKAGGDADQAKGDGALDTKKSFYVTHSYNHFWDTGKSNLTGNKESINDQNYITYFGNWYDHSDSRHPRVRIATVHVYNNLFDGVSKYGVGGTMGASIFVENNVFKNTKNPILSSKQGTDALGDGTFSKEDGAIIKAFGNLSIGTTSQIISYQSNNTSFDAYIATTRGEIVPSSVKTLSGGTTYNNFDTKSDFYKYNVIDTNLVAAFVMAHSGRVNGGDFSFEFSDADNTSYDVNVPLMNKLIGYKTTIVAIGNQNK